MNCAVMHGGCPGDRTLGSYRSLLFVRGPRPYFATAHVPIEANSATAIPEGMVVVFVPLPVVETKSGPQTALQVTAIHIAVIASEAHISRTWSTSNQLCSGVDRAGGCERLDMATSFLHSRLAGPRPAGIRDETGTAA